MPITQLDNSPRCRHSKITGESCKAPARAGTDYCLFHSAEHVSDFHFTYPTLEDAHSIQFAVSDVLHGLRKGQVEYRAAALMLYGLQIAAGNLKRLDLEAEARNKNLCEFDDESLAEAVLKRLDEIDRECAVRDGRAAPACSNIEEARAAGRLGELLRERLGLNENVEA